MMKTVEISFKKKTYKVEQPISTINLYKITHPNGLIEITRNKYSGEWKVLCKSQPTLRVPMEPIVKAIEENLSIVN